MATEAPPNPEKEEEIETGIDPETIDSEISEPFDPKEIRVKSSTPTISLLLDRMEDGAINLAPDFQRRAGIWTPQAKSRLIESILIRIPLPAFYVDASDEDYWLVVDGLQRLTSIKQYVKDQKLDNGQPFSLSGLEFLKELEGKTFDDLPSNLKRRIKETELTVFQIQPGTPPQVKFNIFKRINTGGLPLSAQEIRNAINGDRVRKFVQELAQSDQFLGATLGSIGDKRMADRECVTRFLAFRITDPADYQLKDFDGFLNDCMSKLDDPEETSDARLDELRQEFLAAMDRAARIFEYQAFRKFRSEGQRLSPINKALFESTACGLASFSQDEADELIHYRQQVIKDYEALNKDPAFDSAISQGTGDPTRLRLRFEKMKLLLQDNLVG